MSKLNQTELKTLTKAVLLVKKTKAPHYKFTYNNLKWVLYEYISKSDVDEFIQRAIDSGLIVVEDSKERSISTKGSKRFFHKATWITLRVGTLLDALNYSFVFEHDKFPLDRPSSIYLTHHHIEDIRKLYVDDHTDLRRLADELHKGIHKYVDDLVETKYKEVERWVALNAIMDGGDTQPNQKRVTAVGAIPQTIWNKRRRKPQFLPHLKVWVSLGNNYEMVSASNDVIEIQRKLIIALENKL